MILHDTFSACKVCGIGYWGDGYQWTCDNCRHPQKPCRCGSDDVILDWHIVTDPNGESIPDPSWCVECQTCERRTVYYNTAQEANAAWMNGEILTPIAGTAHFEEMW